MSRKKKHEHVNHERWLVSYADFITLLFAFFVVLFASSQSDKKKQQQVAAAMNQAFSQMALFEPHSRTPPLSEGGAAVNARPQPIALPNVSTAAGEGDQRERLRQRVQKMVEEQIVRGRLEVGDVAVRVVDEGVALSLHEGGFFDSGSADLRSSSRGALSAIAAEIPVGSIRVEGHTDNQPIHSTLYASNWELSSARASTIARFLLDHSALDPHQVAVAGYAEFHPVVSNASAEGRAQNRRVDIVFLAPANAASATHTSPSAH